MSKKYVGKHRKKKQKKEPQRVYMTAEESQDFWDKLVAEGWRG